MPVIAIGRPDMKPSFSLTETELPEIAEWKVGQRYNIILTVEQTEMNKDEDGKMSARFKVITAKGMKKASEPEPEEEPEEEKEEEGYEEEDMEENMTKMEQPAKLPEKKVTEAARRLYGGMR